MDSLDCGRTDSNLLPLSQQTRDHSSVGVVLVADGGPT